MTSREHRRHQLLVERAVGTVVVGLALLVLDHVTLVVEVLLAHGVEEGGHPVRLQPEAQLELVGGQRLEVVGAIEVRGRVADATGTLDDAEVLGLGDVPAALEHEVLEEVGEPGLAGLLVLGAHVVPEIDGHHGCHPVGGHDDPQAVGQRVLAEADVGRVAHEEIAARRAGHGCIVAAVAVGCAPAVVGRITAVRRPPATTPAGERQRSSPVPTAPASAPPPPPYRWPSGTGCLRRPQRGGWQQHPGPPPIEAPAY